MNDQRADEDAAIWGTFWLPDAAEIRLQGQLDLIEQWPVVTLAGGLTPFMQELGREGATVKWGPTPYGPDVEALTVWGSLSGARGRVTLVGAYTRARTTGMFGGADRQTLEARYAIVGAHIDDAQTGFRRARVRVHGLDEWAALPGLEGQADESSNQIVLTYTRPDPLTHVLTAPAGSVSIAASAPWPDVQVAGAEIRPETWASITLAEPLTIDDLWAQFVAPLLTLLTLLHGDDCPATQLDVSLTDSGHSWLTVVHPGLRQPRSQRRRAPLLGREAFGLAALARWIEVTDELSPLPQIIATAITHSDRAVENLLLELATVAEGLHRRLHPDDRQLTVEEVAEGLTALTDPAFPAAAGPILERALRTYLWDVSFPTRLRALAAAAMPVAPEVTGRTKRWVDALVNARNGFAHGRSTGHSATDDIVRHHILGESMRWLLTALLLQHVGVDDAVLANAFEQYDPYRRFLADARERYPRIYSRSTQT